ncbi:antibiotic biosynthesis monooxygenase family protein [Nocardia stercoris]|uniref:Antibiotic biosynthesis monooxygenase n=1 Tax=Nocardia stercoris TaxID=2483361 RepID=A0A3M2KWK2_9NOCA|nr:antibiotic biosynthesis monooxygenase [Nocardia stercoris]RMI29869.1 antibiotic biosynthesis monooxygenase [Nocardia stercoris]
MILEHALLPVRPELTAEFEHAFEQARHIIAAMPGFGSLTLSRCVERPGGYLLLVEWDTLADHTEGFRGSPEYLRWKALLHHFYEPFPVVEHYTTVIRADKPVGPAEPTVSH